MNRFIALDVETANSSLASICQVGFVTFENGQIVDRWQSLINPDCGFSNVNKGIHNISRDDVQSAPTFPEIIPYLRAHLTDQIVAAHTKFDRNAINKSLLRYCLPPIGCIWLNTSEIARRAWPQFAKKGYGLSNLADFLNIQFDHHIAIEDAQVAGEILLRALSKTDLDWFDFDFTNWLETEPPKLETYQEIISFIGMLPFPRRYMTEIARRKGYSVKPGVSKKTTMVIIGSEEEEKSANHHKTLELIQAGYPIKVISKMDFLNLIIHRENINLLEYKP